LNVHKLTARALLVLLLAGIFVPVAVAVAQPAPHACCARKPMQGSTAQIRDAGCDMRCCGMASTRRPVAAGPVVACRAIVETTSAIVRAERKEYFQPFSTCHFGRAPPVG